MRSVERGICPIAEFIMNNSVIFHCACVKLPYFYFWSKSDGWNRQDDQPVTAKFRGDFSIFQFFKMAAATILDFLKFQILTVGRVKRIELHHCARFHGNRIIGQTVAEIALFSIFPR